MEELNSSKTYSVVFPSSSLYGQADKIYGSFLLVEYSAGVTTITVCGYFATTVINAFTPNNFYPLAFCVGMTFVVFGISVAARIYYFQVSWTLNYAFLKNAWPFIHLRPWGSCPTTSTKTCARTSKILKFGSTGTSTTTRTSDWTS